LVTGRAVLLLPLEVKNRYPPATRPTAPTMKPTVETVPNVLPVSIVSC
jgi:hypothetical protein